ncbi:MAG: VOC family protein [Dehalococcoidia bacterium]|nr:VOC family protein [Dehalococcoidia bacterium]
MVLTSEEVGRGGSPLSVAIVGVERLESSLTFYRDILGLDASPETCWRGPAFEHHWRLPAGSSARAVLLAFPGSTVGRILLLEFDAPHRQVVRRPGEDRPYGIWNLNFYTYDIARAARDIEANGYQLWSRPTAHVITASAGAAAVGEPTEVLFEGPDGVVINLVQLPAGEGTRVGEMRRYLDQHGTTPTGYTEVVTSAHTVRDMTAAVRFYQEVLGMGVLIDAVLESPVSNSFLHLPPHARTHSVFVKGDHMFGKIALGQPLNYEALDLVGRAVPPNIGYLAMGFRTPDLAAAEAACRRIGVQFFSEPIVVDLPGEGWRRAMVVHAPASGALMQIAEGPRH